MRPPARSTRSFHTASPSDDILQPVNVFQDTPSTSLTKPPNPVRSESSHSSISEKKPQKPRHRLTEGQLEQLEALHNKCTHPSRQEKQALGDQFGMSLKTVTIWFQNRRQTAKKRTSMSPPAASVLTSDSTVKDSSAAPRRARTLVPTSSAPYTRPALSTVYDTNSNIPQRNLIKRSYTLPDAPLMLHTLKVSPQELWQHLPSSPPTECTDFSRLASPVLDTVEKSQTLEWACAQMQKRQRLLQPAEKESDSGSSTEGGDTETDGDNSYGCEDTSSEGGSGTICITRDYGSQFSPDLLLGASLLLTFKNSMNR